MCEKRQGNFFCVPVAVIWGGATGWASREMGVRRDEDRVGRVLMGEYLEDTGAGGAGYTVAGGPGP